MITSVALEHWRSHLRSEFSFSAGTNVLVGMMGGGKSSVMDAICFALFGTFPALQQRRLALDDLLLRAGQQRTEARATLEFMHNNKRYQVSRRIALGKGTIEAELREDSAGSAASGRPAEWALREANPANVTREVERLLGVDYDLFAKAIYAEQDGLDAFLRLPRGQRTVQIDRMLQLESFAAMRDAAVALANRVEAGRGAEQALLTDAEKEKPEGRLQELVTQLVEARAAAQRAMEKRQQLESERSAAQAEVAAAEAADERHRTLSLALERAQAALAERQQQAAELEQRALPVPIADPAALDSLRAQLLTTEREQAVAEQETAGLQERLERLKSDRCPLCEQPLPADRQAHLAAERKQRLEQLRQQRQRAAKETAQLRASIRRAEQELRSAQAASAQREAAQAALDGLRAKMQELEGRIGSLEQQLASAPMPASELPELRSTLAAAIAQAAAAAAEAKAAERSQAVLAERVQEWEQRVAQVQALRDRVASGLELTRQLRLLTAALEQAQELLRAEYLAVVNRAMNRVWTALYPYGDFAELRLRRDGDYLLELRGPNGWIVADVASGGERALAALALRIAFALAFAPALRWLILDEPTHNLDSAAVKLLAEALRERLGGLLEQCFVVTHDERLAEAGAQVYRLERDPGKRAPTKVVAV